MARKRRGILSSLFSVIWWLFLAWLWWGDDIKVYISNNSNTKIIIEESKNIIDEEIKPEIQKLIVGLQGSDSDIKEEFNKAKAEFEVNKEKKEKPPEKNVNKLNDDPYDIENKYGNNNKW